MASKHGLARLQSTFLTRVLDALGFQDVEITQATRDGGTDAARCRTSAASSKLVPLFPRSDGRRRMLSVEETMARASTTRACTTPCSMHFAVACSLGDLDGLKAKRMENTREECGLEDAPVHVLKPRAYLLTDGFVLFGTRPSSSCAVDPDANSLASRRRTYPRSSPSLDVINGALTTLSETLIFQLDSEIHILIREIGPFSSRRRFLGICWTSPPAQRAESPLDSHLRPYPLDGREHNKTRHP